MPKPRSCPCGNKFYPKNSLHRACCLDGAKIVAKEVEAKKARKKQKEDKERIKNKGEWEAELQKWVNKYVRLRDADDPCISCGRYHQGQYHAGHYKSRGAHPELRFDLANIHKQCAPCNNHKSGDISNYRINLIAKIGQAEVDRLEGYNPPRHDTIEDIKAKIVEFKQMVREIDRERRTGDCSGL